MLTLRIVFNPMLVFVTHTLGFPWRRGINTAMQERELRIVVDGNALGATLSEPPHARGLIIFAHGSGSSRFSARNRFVAESLVARGFATLLLDLLTTDEDEADRRTAEYRFDISLLARRVERATAWWRQHGSTPDLKPGYFGASTGAAAALLAASVRDDIFAVVSRGGRPDLAGAGLPKVSAPTLLIVGSLDTVVIGLNREAAALMRAPHELAIVPGAGHLFEEPGTLEEVARLAGEWFLRYV